MENRVHQILSPGVMKLIKGMEEDGYDRYFLVSLLIANKDVPPEVLLSEQNGEQVNTPVISGHAAAYKEMLIEAILTGLSIKEDIAAMQELLHKKEEEEE